MVDICNLRWQLVGIKSPINSKILVNQEQAACLVNIKQKLITLLGMSYGKVPNERLYYMGGESMAQSISMDDKKYSMRFESMADSKERSSSQFKKLQMNESRHQQVADSRVKLLEGEPKALGAPIFNTIKERYKVQNKRDENNPDVLYDFWMLHRKQATPNQREKHTSKMKETMKNTEKVQPDVQRRIFNKMQFDKYLDYQPQDIYYTLVVESTKYKRDQEIQKQLDAANRKPRQSSTKKITDQHIINRLYNKNKDNKKGFSPQNKSKSKSKGKQQKQDSKMKFVADLIDLYRDRVMNSSPMTIDALYNFWISVPDKDKHGLVLASADVNPSIHKYMTEQVQNLKRAHNDKKGFECTRGITLQKFFQEASKDVLSKYKVSIPQASFRVFLQEFNKSTIENQKKQDQQNKLKAEEEEKKLRNTTTLSRPASATPLSILAQAKSNLTEEALELIKLYPHDKALKQVLKTRIHPPARRPEQYGIYQPEQQIKIKGWAKTTNQKGVNPQKIIEKMVLTQTLQNFGTFGPAQPSANVKKILNQQYLQDDQKWSDKKVDLKQELKILAYKQNWCRNGLISFAQQQMGKKQSELENMNDSSLIDSIIDFINKLTENARKAKLAYLNHDLNLQEAKNKFECQQKNFGNNDQEQKKLKNQFFRFLHSNVRKYVKKFLSNQKVPAEEEEADQINRITFLKRLYEDAKSAHPVYVQKHFPLVNSNAHHACPPNFKNEFYKLVKQLNKYTGKRGNKVPKSHIWAPTGTTTAEGINQATFNKVVKDYSRNKSVLEQTRREDPFSPSKTGKPTMATETVWSKDKLDDRLKFLMTYDEAKECTFKPIIHKTNF